jgi:hypothetical protein
MTAATAQIAFRYRPQDSATGVTRTTAKRLAEALGVDEFIYYASLGLGLKEQRRSMALFCKEVIPAFERADAPAKKRA